MRTPKLLIASLLLALSLPGSSAVCDPELLAGRSEAKLLQAFRAQDIQITEIKILSLHNVFAVKTSGGATYVLRFPHFAIWTSLKFERFAAELVSQAPGVRTPQVRLLSKAQTAEARRKILDAPERPVHYLGKGMLEPGAQASIAVFYPGMKTGMDYLIERGRFQLSQLERMSGVDSKTS